MRKFWAPNITTTGRILRALWGLTCIVAGVLLRKYGVWITVVFCCGGVFALFEAARGWCVMRACGVKTRY